MLVCALIALSLFISKCLFRILAVLLGVALEDESASIKLVNICFYLGYIALAILGIIGICNIN